MYFLKLGYLKYKKIQIQLFSIIAVSTGLSRCIFPRNRENFFKTFYERGNNDYNRTTIDILELYDWFNSLITLWKVVLEKHDRSLCLTTTVFTGRN